MPVRVHWAQLGCWPVWACGLLQAEVLLAGTLKTLDILLIFRPLFYEPFWAQRDESPHQIPLLQSPKTKWQTSSEPRIKKESRAPTNYKAGDLLKLYPSDFFKKSQYDLFCPMLILLQGPESREDIVLDICYLLYGTKISSETPSNDEGWKWQYPLNAYPSAKPLSSIFKF